MYNAPPGHNIISQDIFISKVLTAFINHLLIKFQRSSPEYLNYLTLCLVSALSMALLPHFYDYQLSFRSPYYPHPHLFLYLFVCVVVAL